MDGTIHDPHQHLDSGKKEIISVYLVIKINDVDFLVILTIVKKLRVWSIIMFHIFRKIEVIQNMF